VQLLTCRVPRVSAASAFRAVSASATRMPARAATSPAVTRAASDSTASSTRRRIAVGMACSTEARAYADAADAARRAPRDTRLQFASRSAELQTRVTDTPEILPHYCAAIQSNCWCGCLSERGRGRARTSISRRPRREVLGSAAPSSADGGGASNSTSGSQLPCPRCLAAHGCTPRCARRAGRPPPRAGSA